ncbi:hypothetical protein E4A48_01400 [Xanthomonas cerealis pv. cerealis]|uniref:Lipoprotein n=1 Tax=Xanthomonas cerealis pv. cerealis TaxID=152263 RepID=A0A514E9A3_9XANT|nr:hypothetical protein [Xanthomonas translucens]QDI02535.1 hypothetical protein E4A48_01400 [Xanthomonas translucens pv. cerealis]
MRKARLAVVGMLIVFMAGCSGGRPSQTEREFAFLQFVKQNSNDEARIEDFDSNQCTKAEGAPGYTCDASAKVEAMGRDFGHQMDGVYTFTKVGGAWKVTGRVQ